MPSSPSLQAWRTGFAIALDVLVEPRAARSLDAERVKLEHVTYRPARRFHFEQVAMNKVPFVMPMGPTRFLTQRSLLPLASAPSPHKKSSQSTAITSNPGTTGG
jgi:hypothetical protein